MTDLDDCRQARDLIVKKQALEDMLNDENNPDTIKLLEKQIKDTTDKLRG